MEDLKFIFIERSQDIFENIRNPKYIAFILLTSVELEFPLPTEIVKDYLAAGEWYVQLLAIKYCVVNSISFPKEVLEKLSAKVNALDIALDPKTVDIPGSEVLWNVKSARELLAELIEHTMQ